MENEMKGKAQFNQQQQNLAENYIFHSYFSC